MHVSAGFEPAIPASERTQTHAARPLGSAYIYIQFPSYQNTLHLHYKELSFRETMFPLRTKRNSKTGCGQNATIFNITADCVNIIRPVLYRLISSSRCDSPIPARLPVLRTQERLTAHYRISPDKMPVLRGRKNVFVHNFNVRAP